jgi:hypothetical protein
VKLGELGSLEEWRQGCLKFVVVVVVQEMSVMKSQICVDIYGKCYPTHFVV